MTLLAMKTVFQPFMMNETANNFERTENRAATCLGRQYDTYINFQTQNIIMTMKPAGDW